MRHPKPIQARFHESAVSRVTRTYDATFESIIAELFQNSRRAGATAVRVTVESTAPEHLITVTDDGCGIRDAAVLLSFGENGWDPATVRREDAAGMGILSLAHRNSTISSRHLDPDDDHPAAWTLHLNPAHFLGDTSAYISPDDDRAPKPHGTTITFPVNLHIKAIWQACNQAAHFYPVPVTFVDRTTPKETQTLLATAPFLEDAVYVEGWNGVVFGVYHSRSPMYRQPDLNFFGHMLHIGLPYVDTVAAPTWTVRADVRDCPDLELVLPAREKPVENAFLGELRAAARIAIYRAMSRAEDPRPRYEDWTAARAAAIDINPPKPLLAPWRPDVANHEAWSEPTPIHTLHPDPLLMACSPETPVAQAIWRAAQIHDAGPRLYEAKDHLKGYPWYDALDTVDAAYIQVTIKGDTNTLDALIVDRHSPVYDDTLPRPTSIKAVLNINTAAEKPEDLVLPTDLAFAAPPGAWASSSRPLVTADSRITPQALTDLIVDSYFSPSDDCSADSFDTQEQACITEARHLANKILLSREDALNDIIVNAITNHLLWRLPHDRTVTITIKTPNISVAFTPDHPDEKPA